MARKLLRLPAVIERTGLSRSAIMLSWCVDSSHGRCGSARAPSLGWRTRSTTSSGRARAAAPNGRGEQDDRCDLGRSPRHHHPRRPTPYRRRTAPAAGRTGATERPQRTGDRPRQAAGRCTGSRLPEAHAPSTRARGSARALYCVQRSLPSRVKRPSLSTPRSAATSCGWARRPSATSRGNCPSGRIRVPVARQDSDGDGGVLRPGWLGTARH